MDKKVTPTLPTQAIMAFISKYATTTLFVIAAFVIGMLWTEVRYLKQGLPTGGTNVVANAGNTAPTGNLGQPPSDQAKNVPPLSGSDHFRGDKNAKVTLIEYSDLECPFCQRFHPEMEQIVNDYKGKVKWVFRHFPLSIHPNAQKAAETAECVAKIAGEEAFWKFTSKYYETTPATGTGIAIADMPKLAAQWTGANEAAVRKCQESGEMAQRVNDSEAGGVTAGVNGTPGTVIMTDDGKFDFISGALPVEQVKTVVDKYVK